METMLIEGQKMTESELRPRFWTISLLTLCCRFPSHIFKIRGWG